MLGFKSKVWESVNEFSTLSRRILEGGRDARSAVFRDVVRDRLRYTAAAIPILEKHITSTKPNNPHYIDDILSHAHELVTKRTSILTTGSHVWRCEDVYTALLCLTAAGMFPGASSNGFHCPCTACSGVYVCIEGEPDPHVRMGMEYDAVFTALAWGSRLQRKVVAI